MVVGVPKEIKNNENRVGVTPAGVFELKKHGHTVLVEKGAGVGSAITDAEYVSAGAEMVSVDEVWAKSDIICKVKEPIEPEYSRIRDSQVLFTYLHLAPDPEQTKALLKARAVGIAYETVQLADGSLPLLNPMSEVAGRMSVQIGATYLQKNFGGSGMLLGGVPGVAPATVVVFGAGTVGANAAKIAMGMGADVTILDINKARLNHLDEVYNGRLKTVLSSHYSAAEYAAKADLLIGAVLVPGAKAPTVVTEDMVKTMKSGSVIVDVAIDQGGCVETVDHATTHDNPFYVKHGVIHYSVANMPGAVPRTSTFALSGVTLPYLVRIANLGAEAAMKNDPSLMKGLNVYKGKVTFKGVCDALGYEYADPTTLF